ncbi:MAG: S8 family serine peptidase [Acutalibacteraceae bacterium]|nr:S8 family serine peptidase [Acutalibacteraceae bacterium]
MKFKKIISVVLSAVLLAVCMPVLSTAQEVVTAEYVEDEIIFEYTPTVSAYGIDRSGTSFSSKIKALGVIELNELETYEEEYLSTNSVSSESVTYVAKISGNVEKTCREMEKLDGVTYAEPNYLLETYGYTTPVELSKTSGFYPTWEKWYLEDIMNIPAAWEKYQTCGEGVTVAVIDNGYYLEASDFPTNLWDDGNGNHGWNTANNTSDISPAMKPDGTALNDSVHGSNVAGVIGMASNGANGIGAAFGAELMLIKVASDNYTSSDTKTKITSAAVASGINYARVYGADVINMSLGILSSYPTTIKTAIDAAYSAGVVLIASAGNNATGTATALSYPAAASNVIGVMAIDKTDTSSLTDFSNYDENGGAYYDVAAPGYAVLGCGIEAGKFSLLSGTSQSSPLVAACTALYLSVYPDRSVDDVYNSIRNSATKTVTSNSTVSTSQTYQYKILDAVELLDFGEIKPEIEFNLSTTIIHEPKTGYIYGLNEGYASISDYITVTEGTGTTEFVPTALGNGTGSVLNVYTLSGELYKTYTVIIFGDVNGDCIADGHDAVITDCIANNFGEYSDCIKYAADVDFDGTVDQSDVQLIAGYAIGTDFVSQIR